MEGDIGSDTEKDECRARLDGPGLLEIHGAVLGISFVPSRAWATAHACCRRASETSQSRCALAGSKA